MATPKPHKKSEPEELTEDSGEIEAWELQALEEAISEYLDEDGRVSMDLLKQDSRTFDWDAAVKKAEDDAEDTP